jgi:DNA-entry nuclease
LCGCRKVISLDEIPDYKRDAYVEINGGDPFFTEKEITDEAYEKYAPLDPLGRCGVAVACIGTEIMPTEERGEIASITPTGWEYGGLSNNNQYDFVENKYIYNRCHLIGYQLAGENDNERNLITGTRYMNIEGMLPFENEVADYVEDSGNHVMYRVTPIFNGLDYVARGVLMEGYSVEDNGRGISFCIYAYNVQPGVTIDYFTGVNVASGNPLPNINTDNDNRNEIANGGTGSNSGSTPPDNDNKNEDSFLDSPEHKGDSSNCDYIINVNSLKFHLPDASCINDKFKEENRKYYIGTKEELTENGYVACKICKP